MNKSPERFSFQKDNFLKRKTEEGKQDDPDTIAMLEYYESIPNQIAEKESNPDWKDNNMEYDLRSTEWICDKVKGDDVYAQNLYAAMCNRDFQRNDMMPILKDQKWSCSWRYAGGIVADMQEKGDYIDWYCSGIRNNDELDDDQFRRLTKEQQEFHLKIKSYVGEGMVTDEIRSDLKKLGWLVLDNDEDIAF